ncbi:hypothetical protein DV735_g3632, partial [Chaetothyriales sp. CBS 134920]
MRGDFIMRDGHSAQVPAFFHLLLLESLGAPDNELKDEYVRERRRLAKLYGLQLGQSETRAAKEYVKNRSAGLVARRNRNRAIAEAALAAREELAGKSNNSNKGVHRKGEKGAGRE